MKANSDQILVDRILSAPGMISVLHAPAGYGKTALLQELRRTLLRRNIAVGDSLVGSGEQQSFSWLLLEEDEVRDLNPALLRHHLERLLRSDLGVVIATRYIDRLPIARLRAEGKVLHFGPEQLRISRRDSEAWLRVVVDRGTAQKLARLSDGWPVALGLLRNYAQGAGAKFESDGGFLNSSGLTSYIDQEIFNNLDVECVSALCSSSIVDKFDENMINFVRPGEDLGRLIAQAHEDLPGIIQRVDGIYTLNPIIRLQLRKKFERLSWQRRVETLERAALYCSRAGRVAEAASLVTQVGTYEAIVDFVRRSQGLRLWITGGYDVIREIVSRAEPRGLESDPRIKLLKCLVHTRVGEIDEAERLFDEVRPQLEGDEDAERDAAIVYAAILIYGCKPISDRDLSRFRKSVLRSGRDASWQLLVLSMQSIIEIQRGNLDAAAAAIFEATQHGHAAGAEYGRFFLDLHSLNAALARGDMHRARGILGQARKTCRQKFADDAGLQTVLDSLSASLEFETGRLSSARVHLRRSAQRRPHVEAWLDIYIATYEPMARLLVADMGLASTLVTLRREQEELISRGLPRVASYLKALESCLTGEAALRGEATASLAAPLDGGALPTSESWQERELFALVEAYGALRGSLPQKAIDVLGELVRFAEARGLHRSLLRARLLLVAAFDALGDADEADRMFEDALAIGGRTGMSRAFAEIGGSSVYRRCRARIEMLNAGQIAEPALVHLLRAIARGERGPPREGEAKFTPRERDVLVALDLGGADKQIGRRLGVTEHAVRYHLLNIYRKLGVHDRVGALAKARKAGLFD